MKTITRLLLLITVFFSSTACGMSSHTGFKRPRPIKTSGLNTDAQPPRKRRRKTPPQTPHTNLIPDPLPNYRTILGEYSNRYAIGFPLTPKTGFSFNVLEENLLTLVSIINANEVDEEQANIFLHAFETLTSITDIRNVANMFVEGKRLLYQYLTKPHQDDGLVRYKIVNTLLKFGARTDVSHDDETSITIYDALSQTYSGYLLFAENPCKIDIIDLELKPAGDFIDYPRLYTHLCEIVRNVFPSAKEERAMKRLSKIKAAFTTLAQIIDVSCVANMLVNGAHIFFHIIHRFNNCHPGFRYAIMKQFLERGTNLQNPYLYNTSESIAERLNRDFRRYASIIQWLYCWQQDQLPSLLPHLQQEEQS